MRWTLTIVGLLLIAPGARAQDEAKKLYDAMEQKLTKAKAYKFDIQMEGITGTDQTFSGKGTLILAVGNRIKFTMVVEDSWKKGKVTTVSKGKAMMVSDGMMIIVQGDVDGKTIIKPARPVREEFGNTLTMAFAQVGVFGGILDELGSQAPIKLNLSGFKNVGKEKVNDRQANIIEYEITVDENRPHKCKLWLDAETNLPLKRIVEFFGDGRHRVIETYRGWELDPKLADDTFALPK